MAGNVNDQWYIRNILRKNFFDADLFGYTLPINNDTYFFGRQQIVARYIDSIKRCENRGVFGLRKTGKTSLLFMINRVIRDQNLGFVFFYDCKSPSYRKMHWNVLLGEICGNIAKRLNIYLRPEYDEISIIKSFRYVMKEATIRNLKIVLMFDEIEYISFRAPLDDHWKTEFLDFWQTLWSIQSIHRNLVFIISGVNPSVTEIDRINGVQNPLFGIVQSEYLKGLSEDEIRTMMRSIGKRMGLKFSHDTIDALYKQYCGHPMLTRLACSFINRQYSSNARPVIVSLDDFYRLQEDIDSELSYYFQHIISEIQQFYIDEYEMFELLASGQVKDFIELSQVSEYVKHLYDYGLVCKNNNGIPEVNMPVAGRYVAMQLAKKENRNTLYKIIDQEKRPNWIKERISLIIRDLRHFETVISAKLSTKLFGENSFPEADVFQNLGDVKNRNDFQNFINACNRCFVESIENYGVSIGKDKYFWSEIKNTYPMLFSSLERIKVYRHSQDHAKLNETVAKKYLEFFEADTKGITNENEKYFCIQQKLLEGFIVNIQAELNRLT